MGKFAPSELISSTDFIRNFGKYSKSIKDSKIQKIGILKNNNLDMVVISGLAFKKMGDFMYDLFGNRDINEKNLNRLKGMDYKEILDKYTDKNGDSLFLEGDEVGSYLDAVFKTK